MPKRYDYMTKPRWYQCQIDDRYEDRGANDEYYEAWCAACCEKTEHDACTGRCVEC